MLARLQYSGCFLLIELLTSVLGFLERSLRNLWYDCALAYDLRWGTCPLVSKL